MSLVSGTTLSLCVAVIVAPFFVGLAVVVLIVAMIEPFSKIVILTHLIDVCLQDQRWEPPFSSIGVAANAYRTAVFSSVLESGTLLRRPLDLEFLFRQNF